MRTDETNCQCGGKSLVYSSKRKLRWVIQYRRCDQCGETSKTLKLRTHKRRLTAEQVTELSRTSFGDLVRKHPNACFSLLVEPDNESTTHTKD